MESWEMFILGLLVGVPVGVVIGFVVSQLLNSQGHLSHARGGVLFERDEKGLIKAIIPY